MTIRPLSQKESQLEKKFVAMVQSRGGLARKFVSPNQRGVPDRIVVWPKGHIHFVELKTHNGKLGKLQISEQKKLTERGCTVFNLYGLHDIEQYITNVAKTVMVEKVAA
ncbi:MAG: VRR-NUC domain-containing protein [Candidatus Hamiltonella defensa (Ceratovacuna japonica)]